MPDKPVSQQEYDTVLFSIEREKKRFSYINKENSELVNEASSLTKIIKKKKKKGMKKDRGERKIDEILNKVLSLK